MHAGDESMEKARRGGLSVRWAWWALTGTALLTLLASHAERRLPPARPSPPPHEFDAFRAHRHVANLTAIGPRVAGSYENEVVAVKWVVETLREMAAQASPHNRLEIDVHTSSGAFPLTFLDGMNNVYRDVQSVVARASGVGGRRARTAVLLNCHVDTVPDSPGASDDGAGCAVVLETLRALVSSGRPLRHDVVCLLNGAEENILQASHGFVAGHRWAKLVRAFINVEACGAGGREVLFQAGPHDPWLLEVYAAQAPHPFASSLAQELFQSGLIPADTDFRIFRDFGGLSGVDLAWNSNGYVYHTYLDTAERVSPAALQRTGDNVLALVQGLLASPQLEADTERVGGAPVYFDVLGVAVVALRPGAALAAAGAALALAVLRARLSAREARAQLHVGAAQWARLVALAMGAQAVGAAAGLGGAAALGAALHWWGARLAFFSRPWLVWPLYGATAVGSGWVAARAAWARRGGRWGGVRGWWAVRAHAEAWSAWCALALALCAARGLRSGFVPLAWGAALAVADVVASLLRLSPPRRALAWECGAALPAAHTAYLALASLNMFVPIMGRVGTPPVPADVIIGVMVAMLTLATLSWMTPVVIGARSARWLVGPVACVALGTAALVAAGLAGAPYGPLTPQRVLVFHTRRTDHAANATELLFWIPEIDANTPRSLEGHVAAVEAAAPTRPEDCARWVYCGAPYYLPVRSLIARGHSLPARTPPLPRLHASLSLRRLNATTQALRMQLRGPSHLVAVLAPAEGAHIAWTSVLERPLAGPKWGRRLTYFFALHRARGDAVWDIEMHIQHNLTVEPETWVELSLAGHSLFGELALADEHRRLLRSLPRWTAPTGWGVDLHLYRL